MRAKSIYVILMCLMIFGCWIKPKQKEPVAEKSEKYFQFIKVNNDLTFSGVNELSKNDLADKEYYHFFYNQGKVTKIKSYSTIAVSFHELNKYLYNVNKEWKEININYSPTSVAYTFTNNSELIKFIIEYDGNNLPISFQVLPFNIDYDNFNILGRSVVYSGKLIYNKENLLEKITWNGSNADYRYGYNRKDINTKTIYKNNSLLYEYRFVLSRYGTIQSIK